MDLHLKGKRAVVTGATKGIGRAIAFGLAAEGCDVAICARDATDVNATVAELKAFGVNAYGASVDVAGCSELESFVNDAASALGGIDILVCNASAFAHGAGQEAFRAAFEVDLMHTRNACEAALPWLERSGAGSIIAISSISGSEDYGYDSVSYGTMKAALFFYVKSLARHVAAKGIRANVVSPGIVGVGMAKRQWDIDPVYRARAKRAIPLGFMQPLDSVADTFHFACSNMSDYMTGTILLADGGCSLYPMD